MTSCGANNTIDLEQARQLFDLIFNGDDWVTVRPIESWTSGGKKRSRVDYQNVHTLRLDDIWPLLPVLAADASERHSCIFYGVCPRFGGNGQYEEKWAIRTVRTLWSDIDDLRPAGVAERCTSSGVPLPTCVIDSGRGVHPYWVLVEPYLIDDAETPLDVHIEWISVASGDSDQKKARRFIVVGGERVYLDAPQNRPRLSPRAMHIEDILAGLATTIGGDHTTDVSRLLRVPGTWRRKDARNGAEPIRCTIAELHPERLYSLEDFEQFALRSPARQRRDKVSTAKLPRARKAISPSLQAKLDEHILSANIAHDRSTEDFSLCCFAVRKGIDREYLWSQVAGESKFAARGRPYFDTTWEAACAAVQEEMYDKAAAKQKAASLGPEEADSVIDERGRIPDIDARFKTLGVPRVLADAIMATESFAVAAGKLFHYADGVYRKDAERFVHRRVIKILRQNDATLVWSDRMSNEVVTFISRRSPDLWECPPMDRVCLKNGILRLADRQLLPHTPDWLSDVQLPVAYDPDAKCPHTDKFDREVFPEDCIELSHEIVAWLMVPDMSTQKAILMIGEGGNGKSRKLAQLVAFLGQRNVKAMSLHSLEGDRFATAQLRGRLANICPDLPSSDLSSTSIFKAILGGDTIEAQHKFCDSFSFRPFTRLLFSANHAPRSADGSSGFFDRWLVIPFAGRFRGTSGEILQAELDARLQAPEELSGLLNHALDVIGKVLAHGLSAPESVRAANAEFRAATDPLAVWLSRYTVDDPHGFVPCETLHAAYGAECERKGRPVMTPTMLGLRLAELRPGKIERRQRTVAGRKPWCYLGIDMLHDAGVDSVKMDTDREEF